MANNLYYSRLQGKQKHLQQTLDYRIKNHRLASGTIWLVFDRNHVYVMETTEYSWIK